MSEWVSVIDRLPPISYEESDAPDHPYEAFDVLLLASEGKMTYTKEDAELTRKFNKISLEEGMGFFITDPEWLVNCRNSQPKWYEHIINTVKLYENQLED